MAVIPINGTIQNSSSLTADLTFNVVGPSSCGKSLLSFRKENRLPADWILLMKDNMQQEVPQNDVTRDWSTFERDNLQWKRMNRMAKKGLISICDVPPQPQVSDYQNLND